MKMSLSELRLMIAEAISLHESVDHESVRSVVNSASKLLAALAAFEDEEHTAAVSSGVSQHLDGLRRSLEDMVQNPTSYLDRPPSKRKIVFRREGT